MILSALKIFIPPLLGLVIVYGLLKMEGFIHEWWFGPDEDIHLDSFWFDLLFFVPVIILAIFIQAIFVIPIWKRFKEKRKLFKLTLIQFVCLSSILSGFSIGFLFWRRVFGIQDLLIGSSIFIFLISIYWIVNLFILGYLERIPRCA